MLERVAWFHHRQREGRRRTATKFTWTVNEKYYLNLHILAEVAKLKFLNSETDRGVVRAPNTQNFCWLVVVPCLRNSHTEEILGINHRAAWWRVIHNWTAAFHSKAVLGSQQQVSFDTKSSDMCAEWNVFNCIFLCGFSWEMDLQ